MKRTLFIIIGVVIVLILAGVLVYILLFSNTTPSTDTYTELGLGDTTDTTYTPGQTNTSDPIVDVEGPERLRQLTTEPVAGYQEISTASTTPTVYYVAAGTGHLFAINLETGEETRISATTIPASHKAVITHNGKYTMIQSGTGSGADFVIGKISTSSESLETGVIDEPIIDFTASTDNNFLYAIKTNSSVVAKEYNPEKGTTKVLFTIPFREAVIYWGQTANATHYIYPKATNQLEGYVYAVIKGVITRLPISGYGLSAVGNEAGVLFSEQNKGTYTTSLYTQSDTASTIFLTVIPEKCTALITASTSLVCAVNSTSNASQMPDMWYRGELTFADDLWLFDLKSKAFHQLNNIKDETGRTIDVEKITPNTDDTHLYFTDSATRNLWMFTNE